MDGIIILIAALLIAPSLLTDAFSFFLYDPVLPRTAQALPQSVARAGDPPGRRDGLIDVGSRASACSAPPVRDVTPNGGAAAENDDRERIGESLQEGRSGRQSVADRGARRLR